MRRFELSQIVNERAAAVAEDYALPIYLDPSNFAVRNPSLDPPDASKPAKNGGGIIQARASALANLVWLPESLDATSYKQYRGSITHGCSRCTFRTHRVASHRPFLLSAAWNVLSSREQLC